MFSRPSSRRKSESSDVNINLVPMLDALVTLVSFLLLTTSFIAIVVIDTPAPLLAPASEQIEKIKDKPLQLTAFIDEKQIILSDWSGSRVKTVIPSITDEKTGELRYDIEKLHQALIEIKLKFPEEKKLILKPSGGVAYESIIGIMDSARQFEKSDPPFYRKDQTKPGSSDILETNLFPEVIFGNIMS